MNNKVSRIALLLVALAASALVVQALVRDDAPEGSAATASETAAAGGTGTTGGGANGKSDEGASFDPLQGAAVAEEAPKTAPDAVSSEETAPELERREVGPPLADGTPVDVSVTPIAGTVSRYRVTNVIAQRDRSNGQSVGQRWVFDVTTKVSGVAEDGSARVRLVVDAIRIQALFPDGLRIDFDSRAPDEEVLTDRNRAVHVKPLLAIVGIPVEFRIGPTGGCTGVEGLEAWNESWVDVVEALSPGSSRKTIPPYTSETMLLEWSEYLFPPILGGTLAAGEERDVQILRDTLQNAYVEFRGPMTPTHDDGEVFRLRLVTTPALLMRQGPARSPQEAAVARVHVQADKDAYYAAWRFDRKAGRLLDAEIDAEYQLWVSWKMGEDPNGQTSYERVFLDVERATRVELLPSE